VRLSDEDWGRMLAVHLNGTFYGTRAAARSMAPRGTGAIVNIASICGIEGCTGHPHYSAAKAGIAGFTRTVAKELILQGVRVNSIAPGYIDTPLLQSGLTETLTGVISISTPQGRLGRPSEVAATVSFLVSDDASFFVGQNLSPNGGVLTF
jgi:3-oxoacyl-[acyl-carrier protein] reductase